MLYFRSCPRCKTGTMQLDDDFFGAYLTCLMCGFTINSKTIRPKATVEAEKLALFEEEQARAASIIEEEPGDTAAAAGWG